MIKVKEVYLKIRQGLKMNKVVQIMTLSDILVVSGFGLVGPIFAVFITEQIKGGDVFTVGLSGSIFSFFSGFLSIPLAQIMDSHKGEEDDFRFLFWGSLMISVVPFLYLFISLPWQLYLTQAFYGLGAAFAYTSWSAIFSRHLDKEKIALEWSLYNTATSLGTAATAAVGGAIAEIFGFKWLFVVSGTLIFLGSMFLLLIAKSMKNGG